MNPAQKNRTQETLNNTEKTVLLKDLLESRADSKTDTHVDSREEAKTDSQVPLTIESKQGTPKKQAPENAEANRNLGGSVPPIPTEKTILNEKPLITASKEAMEPTQGTDSQQKDTLISEIISENKLEEQTKQENSVATNLAETQVSKKNNGTELQDASTNQASVLADLPEPTTHIQSSNYIIAGVFILALALSSLFLKKLNKKRVQSNDDESEFSSLEICQTLALSPKRKLNVIKYRNTEILIANTEHGISFLTEINRPKNADRNEYRSAIATPSPMIEQGTKDSFFKRNTLGDDSAAKSKLQAANPWREQKEPQTKSTPGLSSSSQSEIVLDAIKRIKEKKEKQNLEENEIGLSRESFEGAKTNTLSGKKTFPKYLAQEFAKQSRNSDSDAKEGSTTSQKNEKFGTQDELNNVTDLIRSKLKNLKNLS